MPNSTVNFGSSSFASYVQGGNPFLNLYADPGDTNLNVESDNTTYFCVTDLLPSGVKTNDTWEIRTTFTFQIQITAVSWSGDEGAEGDYSSGFRLPILGEVILLDDNSVMGTDCAQTLVHGKTYSKYTLSVYSVMSITFFAVALAGAVLVTRMNGISFSRPTFYNDMTSISVMMVFVLCIVGNAIWISVSSKSSSAGGTDIYYLLYAISVCFTWTMMTSVCFHWGTVLFHDVTHSWRLILFVVYVIFNVAFYGVQLFGVVSMTDLYKCAYDDYLKNPFYTMRLCSNDYCPDLQPAQWKYAVNDVCKDVSYSNWFFPLQQTAELLIFLTSVVLLILGTFVIQRGVRLIDQSGDIFDDHVVKVMKKSLITYLVVILSIALVLVLQIPVMPANPLLRFVVYEIPEKASSPSSEGDLRASRQLMRASSRQLDERAASARVSGMGMAPPSRPKVFCEFSCACGDMLVADEVNLVARQVSHRNRSPIPTVLSDGTGAESPSIAATRAPTPEIDPSAPRLRVKSMTVSPRQLKETPGFYITKSFQFAEGDEMVIEDMTESPLTNELPRQYLELLVSERAEDLARAQAEASDYELRVKSGLVGNLYDNLIEQIQGENNQNVVQTWLNDRVQQRKMYVEALRECYQVCIDRADQGVNFKASTEKKSLVLRFLPINLHVQDIWLEIALQNPIDSRFLQTADSIGFLFQVESLLSTQGKEIGMLEDFSAAVDALKHVTIVLDTSPPSHLPSTLLNLHMKNTTLPGVVSVRLSKGSTRGTFTVAIGVRCSEDVLDTIPTNLRSGSAISVTPVIFTQGINEMQTLANNASSKKTTLQDIINRKSFVVLRHYVEKYKQLATQWPDTVPTPMSTIAPLLESLEDRIAAASKRQVVKSKHPQIIQEGSRLCRLLGGGRVTSCKSAKDRTGMSVTLEQVRLLSENHGLPEEFAVRTVSTMRSNGTRLENALKNTGKRQYAFNGLQRSLLPDEYKCPEGTYGRGNVS
ncbi:hypothetical protein BBO99_00003119 [Phytophthora kernoviae]|uniref:Uncharacterized protein n=2 Tax=Phytophthora kernoviae TaxID=325452 RepID=A0A421FFU4_9STRA|nr:hypothetical protein G195_003254 [Phytophthora kernoviae 00238/432]KAG2528905.1 hypothetical protein JM16_000963 [Phytophthora kernoviae]KAG2530206.1 hypothetical protein JM18_001044 [Phytophthora kernoviae]RLN44205.1 hypothetical protein BBI17_002984 [Phytophthora kernoviae]RLN82157.1 hypothetical protein BBO99_00003119 [Phytophthora kernoviae]